MFLNLKAVKNLNLQKSILLNRYFASILNFSCTSWIISIGADSTVATALSYKIISIATDATFRRF